MIAIFGATGNTGIHLVKTLVARGHYVCAVVRDETRARSALGNDVELRIADLEQPNTLPKVLAGVSSVYAAIGGPRGTERLVEVECTLIDAAKAAGVQHFVSVAGIDARPQSPSRIQRWHGAISEHLMASRMPYTILEPCFFMQNFLGLAPAIRNGLLPLPTGAGRASLIDARDIADVAAVVLTEPGHLGQRYVLTGPEALSHADAASLFGKVLERRVEFLDVPGGVFEKSLTDAGLPAWFAALLTDVYVQVFATDQACRVTDVVPQLTQHKARTLADFVREHRAAFVPA